MNTILISLSPDLFTKPVNYFLCGPKMLLADEKEIRQTRVVGNTSIYCHINIITIMNSDNTQ